MHVVYLIFVQFRQSINYNGKGMSMQTGLIDCYIILKDHYCSQRKKERKMKISEQVLEKKSGSGGCMAL